MTPPGPITEKSVKSVLGALFGQNSCKFKPLAVPGDVYTVLKPPCTCMSVPLFFDVRPYDVIHRNGQGGRHTDHEVRFGQPYKVLDDSVRSRGRRALAVAVHLPTRSIEHLQSCLTYACLARANASRLTPRRKSATLNRRVVTFAGGRNPKNLPLPTPRG